LINAARKISDLIEDVYDAALEPARWSDVVGGINEFVGGHACGIFSKDSISKFGVSHYYCGADPYYIQLYSDTHCRFDPLASLPPFGKVVSIPDLVPFEEYRSGRFYQEWLRPQGCVDAANVLLEKSGTCPVLLTVLAGKRMVDDEMRRRIAQFVPHLHRSLMINKAIEYKKSEADTFADTLDGLRAGVFLVDAQCQVLHANAAAQEMLGEDDFLRLVAGQLVARDRQSNHDMRQMIANGDAAVVTPCAAIPLTAHDGERYVAHLLPLKSLVRGADAPLKAVAAVFVRKVGLDGQSYGGLIASAFGLTPAELRVLLAIVEVGGVPETSQRLGVAETTVKTHLYRIFSKTGASRQADLVKLAAGFSNPLAN
jgi:DNA-binding CsgD family transcriptional regulator